MDARKKRKNGRLWNFWRGFRWYYQCFVLHFVLGILCVAVLFCCVTGMERVLDAGGLLRAFRVSVYDLQAERGRMELLSDRRAVTAALMGRAVYFGEQSPDAYFGTETASGQGESVWGSGNTEGGDSGSFFGVWEAETGGVSEENTPSRGREGITGDAGITGAGDRAWDELYAYDRSTAVTGDAAAVIPVDLSSSGSYSEQNGGILFSNQTSYTPDGVQLLSRAYPIAAAAVEVETASSGSNSAAPLVLILHTHGTEAYAPDGALSVRSDFSARSEDTAENVVSVGAVLAKTLSEAGISVLHCETMFDRESYTASYVSAAAYIKETVAAYPSIQYVFDVHRDALAASRDNADILRPVTLIDGEVCAQVMSVVGTDAAGADHPGWRDNLTVAVHLQNRLNEAYTAFARPINLRSATFNAQYAPGSILLEIGSSGNSVEEARSAAYYLGKVLAEMILEGE
ncbi:MAG: stage II sporulation protein P [Clostridia bacterium]|nr:stage II sporulation protein P [Clostridia bacterium]